MIKTIRFGFLKGMTKFQKIPMSSSSLSSIFILIRSLDVGGAERQVCVLARALHQKGYKVTVGLFYSGGILEKKLRDEGVTIYPLHKNGRWDLLGWFRRYLKAIQDVNPDVIYSFLTTSNIVAITGRLFVQKPVVWGIRASVMNLEEYDWLAKLTAWVEKKLSRFVKTIIFNANFSRQYHQSLGYCLNNAVVIPNGIDTDVFRPGSDSGKHKLRAQWNIPKEAIVVGMLARVDPMKDYETFLAAARILSARHQDVYFIVAGAGTDTTSWHSLPPRLLRLGIYEGVPELLNTMNIMVLSSLGESFPNVVGEAMACGIPTIATNVGDASYIMGDLGIAIPMKNKDALIQAIESMLQQAPSKEAIRNRIITHFNVPQMVNRTIQTLTEACGSP
jgi:glycosyltransferase involved in cell wall biosynthesis